MHKYTTDLITHCADFSKELLNETKDFYPFGAFISKIGQVHPLELEPEDKNSTQNGQVVNSLLKYLTTEFEKGEILAYATVYEVHFKLDDNSSKQDAFAIDIVNSESEEPVFYYPYTQKNDSFNFEEPFAVKRDKSN